MILTIRRNICLLVFENRQISSTNTQASTFTVNDGTQTITLDFGNVSSPSTLLVNLSFSYTDNENKETSSILGPIEIHFVSDESQKNNTQDRMQSSSQQDSSASQNSQSNPQQSLQQRLDDMLNQPSSQTQDPQQRLQNNQLSQDSNALKQEIQEQIQNENKLQQEFEKQIISNEEFQRQHQQLIEEGYEITQGSLNPITNSTGNFEVNYENSQGQWAKLEESMENGTITDIQKQTQEQRDRLLSKLRVDPTFQEYENQLNDEGFSEQNLEFAYDEDKTSMLISYQDQDARAATIQATFVDDILTEVNLDKPKNDSIWWIYILAIVIAGYLLNRKFRTKKKIPEKLVIRNDSQQENLSFDHVLESQNLLQKAKDDFKKGLHKDAYGKVSQALRLFLSHELNLNREITNEDVLLHLKNTKYPIEDIKDCFTSIKCFDFGF